MVRKKKFRLSTTQIILLGLLETILARSMLLALQIRSAIGKAVRYLDTLLTATTVTCVQPIPGDVSTAVFFFTAFAHQKKQKQKRKEYYYEEDSFQRDRNSTYHTV